MKEKNKAITPNEKPFPFPKPISGLIFDYLDTNSLCNAKRTCHFFNEIALITARNRIKLWVKNPGERSFEECIMTKNLKDLSVKAQSLDGMDYYSLWVHDQHSTKSIMDLIYGTNSVIGVCLYEKKPVLFICYLDETAVYKAFITLNPHGFLHIKALTEKQAKTLVFFDVKNTGDRVTKQPWVTLYRLDAGQLNEDFQTLCEAYENKARFNSIESVLKTIKALPKEVVKEILTVYASHPLEIAPSDDKKCSIF